MSGGGPNADVDDDPSRFLPPVTGYEDEPILSLEEATKPLISLVPKIDNMIHVVKKNCRNPKGGLTIDESASIMLYTSQWTPPEESFYSIFNKTMRLQDRKKLVPWFRYLRLLVEALTKLPEKQPRLLYRGVKKGESAKYPDGAECNWWSFSSCTRSLKIVQDFIGKEGPRTMFNIRCRTAIDIAEHSMHPNEEEMILYPGREFRVLSSTMLENNVHIVDLEEVEPKYPNFYLPKKSAPVAPPSINLLLLGSVDVGKATFITALVNYLKYPQIQQALRSEVRAVIPLSFLYNSSNRGWKMQTIRLGQGDRPRGCQTYTVDVDPANGTKLCLIDTPSFDGDIPPEENLQTILNYMKTLTHINAVCFILKSDEMFLGQLPIYFGPILNALGPNSHENVIFAFTYIQKTLYSLGHTAPLLRELFRSSRMNDIVLNRRNAFLFENAAFRYLMLRKQGIELDAVNDELYTEQWRAAAAESTRLFQRVQTFPRRTLNR